MIGRSVRALGVLAMLAFAYPAVAVAQGDSVMSRWNLAGPEAQYCIWYLADPDLARSLVPSSVVLEPAGSGINLPPLVQRTVRDEPRFATWIPGSICIGFYDSVAVDGKTVARAKAGNPVVIATSALAARSPLGVDQATQYLIRFMSDQGDLRGAAGDLGLRMHNIKVSTRQRTEGGDPDVSFDLDGTKIIWSGHPIGDTSVGSTHSYHFGTSGSHSSGWLVTQAFTPGASRPMVGSLQVLGKDGLAKALKGSPVRAIGPMETAGTAEFAFVRIGGDR